MTRVWVTRDEPPDGPLSTALRRAGLEPVTEPVMERRVVADAAHLVSHLGPDDWLVLASEFSIGVVPPSQVKCRVAVVGESSRVAAVARGIRVELVSPDGTGEGLWRTLRTLGARRVVYPRSSAARAPERWPGVEIHAPVLYETTEREIDRARLAGTAVAAVASPSAVGPALRAAPTVRFASIGPTTTAALRAHGVEPWVQAPESSFGSLAAAIASQLKAEGAGPGATTRQTPGPHR